MMRPCDGGSTGPCLDECGGWFGSVPRGTQKWISAGCLAATPRGGARETKCALQQNNFIFLADSTFVLLKLPDVDQNYTLRLLSTQRPRPTPRCRREASTGCTTTIWTKT